LKQRRTRRTMQAIAGIIVFLIVFGALNFLEFHRLD
jgi:hypothetical protein